MDCKDGAVTVAKAPFGQTPEGEAVELYTLTGPDGLEARIASFGATLVSLKAPDRAGRLANIVLGFDSLAPYLAGVPYFGAVVGRYGNRLANARFTLDGKTYPLAANNGPNNLHGGLRGFDKRVWSAQAIVESGGAAVKFTYVSADGEEGFPGELTAQVTYSLRPGALAISYEATTTGPTVVNLTNHAYFNLSGDLTAPILDHRVMIAADRFTPVDANQIPIGEIRAVKDTPFDFTTATAIGTRIDQDDEQLGYGRGYDHNWVLNAGGGAVATAAIVEDPASGRVLEVQTSEPGVQFYTGNFLDGRPAGEGTVYAHRTGFCLETQHFPDSPNQPGFPSTVLRPGETYRSQTVLVFRTMP
jgi:aldose 1-epimerase